MQHISEYLSQLSRVSSRIGGRYPRVWQFIRLARLDRPVGTLLLLWPTLAALWIAKEGFPGWHLFLVFTLGTLLTRSAGCVANDLIDMRFDGHVKRTQDRPLVTGKIRPFEAVLFAVALLFPALLLVMTTNLSTQLLSLLGVIIAITYPYMKRFTHMPQGVLGIAFSWGIPMAFTAATNTMPSVAWLLFGANLLWVIAYDSLYAMVDRDDDLNLGLKSSAILFGRFDRVTVAILQLFFLCTMLLVPQWIHLSGWYYLGLGMSAGLFVYQHYLIQGSLIQGSLIKKTLSQEEQRQGCFKAFLNNQWVGFCIFAGLVAQYAFAPLPG